MQLLIPTRNSKFIYIDRLMDLIAISKVMRVHYYLFDATKNTLFASLSEPFAIHEFAIPFRLESTVFISSAAYMDKPNKDVLEKQYTDFFYMSDFPYIAFPEYIRSDIMNGHISYEYDEIYGCALYDNRTNTMIDYIRLYRPDSTPSINIFYDQIQGMYNRQQTLGNSNMFYDIHSIDTVSDLLSRTVSAGHTILSFKAEDGKVFTFYYFKNMFVMSKKDKLDFEIRQDVNETSKFMITAHLTKARNPIKIGETFTYYDKIHMFMLNLTP